MTKKLHVFIDSELSIIPFDGLYCRLSIPKIT